MKVTILGAGAMGCLVGYHLKLGGAQVYLVDPYAAHMEAIQNSGLKMILNGEAKSPCKMDGATTNSAEVGVSDVVITLVKGITTRQIVADNQCLFDSETVVITFQNGIGNIDILKERFAPDHIGFGVLKCGASMSAPGEVAGSCHRGNFKDLYYCPVQEGIRINAIFAQLQEIFDHAGFLAEHYPEAESLVWDKLYLNSIVNVPLAVLHISIQEGTRQPELVPLLRQIGDEVCAVATAKGFPMDADTYWQTNIAPLQKMPLDRLSYSSATQDARKKRPTENDFLNGAVVREGKRLGIPTPANEFIWRMGKAAEAFYETAF